MPSSTRRSGVGSGFRNPLITSADIPDGSITSIKLASSIQSDNYSAGSTGWKIDRDTGSAEFQDVTVRGTVEATAGEIGTLSLTGRLTTDEGVRFGEGVDGIEDPDSHGFTIDRSGSTTINGFWKVFDTGRTLFAVNRGGANSIVFDSAASPALTVKGQLEATRFIAGDLSNDGVDMNPGAWGGDTSQIKLVTGGYPSAGGEQLTLTLQGSGPSVTLGLARSGAPSWPIFELGSGLLTIGTKAFPFPLEVNSINAADGSLAAPAYRFSSDSDSGLYSPGANRLALSAGGVLIGHLSSSGGSPGFVRFQGAFDQTTGSGANLFVASNGNLIRSTSSKRYKAALRPWDRRSSVLDLEPTLYRSKSKADDARKIRLGLIAEDVAERFPIAAMFDDEGRPDAIDWNMIVTGLLSEVRDLAGRVATLEAS